MPDEAGRDAVASSARWIAAARARESARTDRLFADPWAERLASPDGFQMLSAREPDGRPNAYLPVRTRFFDDLVTLPRVQGSQVVLLGAGHDTRALRLPLASSTTVYAVDRENVLRATADVVAEASPTVLGAAGWQAVPADLTADWAARLQDSGFRAERATVWIAEGLLFYLSGEQVHALLADAAALSSEGSVLGADVFGTGLLRRAPMRPLVEHRTRTGTPLPFCTDDPAGLLRSTGWQVDRVVEPGQTGANYGRLPTLPDDWNGGADPTMRTYLLVGVRRSRQGTGTDPAGQASGATGST
ncbi:MAG TPA: SAM-dependent methyltransferase [Cellulomonas sp.]